MFNTCEQIMDEQQFLRKISEVSEWTRETPDLFNPEGKCISRPKTGVDIEKVTDPELFPIKIISFKQQQQICDHCGTSILGEPHLEHKFYVTYKIKHWRTRCLTCMKAQCPQTQEFNLDFNDSFIVWNNWCKSQSLKLKKNQIDK